MKPNNEVLEKLKKILILANDKNAQPGEIEAALGKARELAIRHNIDISSVNFEQDEKIKGAIEIEKDTTLRPRSQYEQPYHRWIYRILNEVFEVSIVRHVYSSNNGRVTSHLTIYGEPFDVAIAVAIFPFLEKVFPRTLSRAVSSGLLTYSMADTNGCYGGLYVGILEANKREIQKLNKKEVNQYAMVVRNKQEVIKAKVAEDFPKLKNRKTPSLRFDPDAVRYGREEGRKIKLNQIHNGNGQSQLK